MTPDFHRIRRLPPYVFEEVNRLKARLRAQGVRLASDNIRTGAGGHRYFFIHPQSAGGVLIEVVEAAE